MNVGKSRTEDQRERGAGEKRVIKTSRGEKCLPPPSGLKKGGWKRKEKNELFKGKEEVLLRNRRKMLVHPTVVNLKKEEVFRK